MFSIMVDHAYAIILQSGKLANSLARSVTIPMRQKLFHTKEHFLQNTLMTLASLKSLKPSATVPVFILHLMPF